MPRFDFQGMGTTIELTETQFLEALLKLADGCQGLAQGYTGNHTSALADFSGTRYKPLMQQVLMQLKVIESEIKAPELRGSFHALSEKLHRLSEIDEEIVQIQAQLNGFQVVAGQEERIELEKRLAKNRRQFVQRRLPDSLRALALESVDILSSIAETKRLTEQIVSGLQVGPGEASVSIVSKPDVQIPSTASSELIGNNANAEITTEIEFGDQRAKDLIDGAGAEVDSEQAVTLLKEALRFGHFGIQASKAYLTLANIYGDKGDDALAIEYYTLSLETPRSGLPNPYTLFWRGQAYYRQRAYPRARSDLLRALALGINSPEREEAESSLTEIARLSADN